MPVLGRPTRDLPLELLRQVVRIQVRSAACRGAFLILASIALAQRMLSRDSAWPGFVDRSNLEEGLVRCAMLAGSCAAVTALGRIGSLTRPLAGSALFKLNALALCVSTLAWGACCWLLLPHGPWLELRLTAMASVLSEGYIYMATALAVSYLPLPRNGVIALTLTLGWLRLGIPPAPVIPSLCLASGLTWIAWLAAPSERAG